MVKFQLKAHSGIDFGIFIDESPDGSLYVKKIFNQDMNLYIDKGGKGMGISDIAR
jgi:hypothetical protein